MKRQTYRHLTAISHWFLLGSLGVAVSWNLASLYFGLSGWWLAILLPIPGLFSWIALRLTPLLLARSTRPPEQTYRLLYSTPDDWSDERVTRALLNLIRSGASLDIIWAKDGAETGCWLDVTDHGAVLERLVRDVFPTGSLEAAAAPEVGRGAVILQWQAAPPAPAELCRQPGIDGIYFRWRGETAATVAIWGATAVELARTLADEDDIWPGQGQALLCPPFVGDNPWPELPPFPSSAGQAGLAAVSSVIRLAPALRTNGAPALVIGQDATQQRVGFTLPDLAGMQLLQIAGQATESMVIDLVQQAVQASRPVWVLDGRGLVTTRLARRLLREVAIEKVLVCDVERPAQSRFRLNPLWLPGDEQASAAVLSTGWLAWLRELGVTPGGLGQTAYRHTQVAVVLTALVAARRGLPLDVPGLREALLTPDFLPLVDEAVWTDGGLLTDDIWTWWQTDGRRTTSFDTHLRLAHLRDRLGALLELPEYSVLWRAPYLDPLAATSGGQSLFWRLPDSRRRLPPYVSSQLLTLSSLLTVWPEEQPPLLIFLHELPVEGWITRLRAFPSARLIVSTDQVVRPRANGIKPTALLLSRLSGEDAARMEPALPGIRAADLRRLPPNRLIFKQGDDICTVDMNGE